MRAWLLAAVGALAEARAVVVDAQGRILEPDGHMRSDEGDQAPRAQANLSWLADGSVPATGHGVHPAESNLTSGHPECTGHGTLVCDYGSVQVLRCGDARKLRFQDDKGIETQVRCKPAPACGDACGACACEFDAGAAPTGYYMRTIVEQLGAVCAAEGTALLLGMGGGELAQYLVHACPRLTVDAVELSADVIAVAERYFGVAQTRKTGRLLVEQADALAAVRARAQEHRAYAAVIVDCFSGRGVVPESCRSADFAAQVRAVLRPSGVLLQNFRHYELDHPEVEASFKAAVATYAAVFPEQVEDLPVALPGPSGSGRRRLDVIKATK